MAVTPSANSMKTCLLTIDFDRFDVMSRHGAAGYRHGMRRMSGIDDPLPLSPRRPFDMGRVVAAQPMGQPRVRALGLRARGRPGTAARRSPRRHPRRPRLGVARPVPDARCDAAVGSRRSRGSRRSPRPTCAPTSSTRRGNRAVWFFSLEATRLPIVVFARWLLGFPYVWATMTTMPGPDGVATRPRDDVGRTTDRRRPTVEIDIGDPIAEPSELDVFLTGRWGAVSRWPMRRGRLRHHPVDHPVWRLHEATLAHYDDTSIEAAGLPRPERSADRAMGRVDRRHASDVPSRV